jgi:ABC-2 type transport system permease protein
MLDRSRLALALAAKDLRIYFRDKAGMALGFLLPIALVTVMGLVMGAMAGGETGLRPQKLRVADLDRSDASAAFLAAMRGGAIEPLTDERRGLPWSRDALLAGVGKGDFPVALVIEPGFAARLAAGERPLELLCDPSKRTELQFLLPGMLRAFAGSATFLRMLADKGVRALREAGAGDPGLERALAELQPAVQELLAHAERRQAAASRPGGGTAALDLSPDEVLAFAGVRFHAIGGGALQERERNRLGFVSQAVAGTAVMMVLFGLTACGASLLRERDDGTLRRLLLSPAPRTAILWGKFLANFTVGVLQLGVMFTWGRLVFGLPVLDRLPGVLLVSLALAAAATSFGILIATVARTQKQVDGISVLVILLMSALGGSWFPRFIMPEWMKTVGLFTLNAWAMDGYEKVFWYDRPVVELWPQVGVLLGLALVLGTVASASFRMRTAPLQT